jgi:hypothetical protein
VEKGRRGEEEKRRGAGEAGEALHLTMGTSYVRYLWALGLWGSGALGLLQTRSHPGPGLTRNAPSDGQDADSEDTSARTL